MFTILLLSSTAFSQINNPCSGLWLGEIVADPNRCDRYFRCYLQVPSIQNCPANTVFNPAARSCEAGNPSTCAIYSQTTTTTTTEAPTEPPTTRPPPTNFNEICRGIFFAARPHPQFESRFVGCIKGLGFLLECDENEWFNPDLGLTGECSNAWP